jgi:hypothetical protein
MKSTNSAASTVTTMPATITVAENAAAMAIGIAAPTDPNYSAIQLSVKVNSLPTDGSVSLANGTAVTNGETLAVAQLTGLMFKPTTGLVPQSSTLAYTVTDPTGSSTTGNATLAVSAATTSLSADGSVLMDGGAGSLVTSAGTWTFNTAMSGGYAAELNGKEVATNPPTLELEVANQGQLYANNSDGSWWLWNGSGWAPSTNPTPPTNPTPTTTPAFLTVAENAVTTSIAIVAPTDPNYAASQLSVTVTGLPTDGTVSLANGTAVTSGETLTVAQLTGLMFQPTAGAFGQNSTFSYKVTDPSGLSATGAAMLAIGPDTTAPVTTAATLTVAENAVATAIGIKAPNDPNYTASQLSVTVTGLPTDGTVSLANGTAVTSGEPLTVAQLTGLMFQPTAGVFGQSSTFSYKVTDPSGLSATGAATLAIGPDTTPPVTTAATLTVAENAAATAIGIKAPTDPNYTASQLSVTLNSLPTDGTVSLANGTAVTNGETLTVAQLTGLTFKPTTGVTSQSSTLAYTVTDPAGLSATGNATLAVGSGSTGGGIVFDNTFTSNVSSAFKADILAAEQQISSLWTNSITLNVTFDAEALGVGNDAAENSWPAFVDVTYSQLKNALTSHASSSFAASAVAALPATDPNPAGGTDWALPEAYARMLGLSSTTFGTDDTVTLNTSYGWSYGQDVTDAVEHELSEGAMGRTGGLGDQNGVWSVMDLFRYNAAGKPDYTDGRDGQTTYFSFNGGVTLSSTAGLSFNNQYNGSTQVNTGDVADFTQQDVFGGQALGETNTLSQIDMEIMDVLGWDPSPSGPASGSTLVSGTSPGGSASSTYNSSPASAGVFDIGLLNNYMSAFATSSADQGPTPLSDWSQVGGGFSALAHPMHG